MSSFRRDPFASSGPALYEYSTKCPESFLGKRSSCPYDGRHRIKVIFQQRPASFLKPRRSGTIPSVAQERAKGFRSASESDVRNGDFARSWSPARGFGADRLVIYKEEGP